MQQHTDEEWKATWAEFFGSITGIINARSNAMPEGPIRAFVAEYGPQIAGHIQDVRLSDIQTAIENFRDESHSYLESTLYYELIAIANANRDAVENKENTKLLDKAVEDSETGKGSLEDLFGEWLPGWLKKALKLLNEILKLIKPRPLLGLGGAIA